MLFQYYMALDNSFFPFFITLLCAMIIKTTRPHFVDCCCSCCQHTIIFWSYNVEKLIHCCSKFKLNPVRRCEEGENKEEDTVWSIPDKRVSKNYENVTFVSCETREILIKNET